MIQHSLLIGGKGKTRRLLVASAGVIDAARRILSAGFTRLVSALTLPLAAGLFTLGRGQQPRPLDRVDAADGPLAARDRGDRFHRRRLSSPGRWPRWPPRPRRGRARRPRAAHGCAPRAPPAAGRSSDFRMWRQTTIAQRQTITLTTMPASSARQTASKTVWSPTRLRTSTAMNAISAARVRARRTPALARGCDEIVTLTVSSAGGLLLASCPCPSPSASGSAQRLNLAVADEAHQTILVGLGRRRQSGCPSDPPRRRARTTRPSAFMTYPSGRRELDRGRRGPAAAASCR